MNFQQVGTDFANQEEVRAYDERMSRFRDFDTENDRVFSALDLSEDATIVEIGCGTELLRWRRQGVFECHRL